MSLLASIKSPDDLKKLSISQMQELAQDIRDYLIETITATGGHLCGFG